MASKDWKKVYDEYKITKWINTNEDEKEVIVEPSGHGDWVVSYIDTLDESPFNLAALKHKRFLSKLRAVKFAKKYMRDN